MRINPWNHNPIDYAQSVTCPVLVLTGKRGKEKTVQVSEDGAKACARYKEVREALLISSIQNMGLEEADVSQIAGMLRALSGQYDQAARGAASL